VTPQLIASRPSVVNSGEQLLKPRAKTQISKNESQKKDRKRRVNSYALGRGRNGVARGRPIFST